MQHDAWFFIGVFVFIFLVWAATGGPTHPISFGGPFLSQPSPLGTGTYIGLPRAPFSIGTSNTELSGSGGSSGQGTSVNGESGNSLSGVSFGTPSGYRGQIELGSYVSGAAGNPQQEYLTLSLASDAKQSIDISGWALESAATGNAVIIPKSTEVPYSGSVEALQDIVLKPGDKAIIISGRSPIGASFRENECIGYFAQFQQFYPNLPNSCPAPDPELHTYYPNYIRDQACISYVDSLNRCTLEITPPAGMTTACDAFLETYLSYNGCVAAHQNDSGFKGDTWRIYLGRTNAMWRSQNEVVKLVDQTGNTVDAFAY